MNSEIKISVIMSVYDTREDYLRRAIDSILEQTFSNFEFIIFDDCSNKDTQMVLQSYSDERIRLYRNETNQGLTVNLNKAIEIATGEYIARMDADDISYPDRLRETYEYMENHKDVHILDIYTLNGNRIDRSWDRLPLEGRRTLFLIGNFGATHSGVLIRRSFLDEHNVRYDEHFKKAQDYDLWVRCLEYTDIYVYPKVLFYYRNHDAQISVAAHSEQEEYACEIRRRLFKKIGADISEDQIDRFIRYREQNGLAMEECHTIADSIAKANKRTAIYPEFWLDYVLCRYLLKQAKNHLNGRRLLAETAKIGFSRRFMHYLIAQIRLNAAQ